MAKRRKKKKATRKKKKKATRKKATRKKKKATRKKATRKKKKKKKKATRKKKKATRKKKKRKGKRKPNAAFMKPLKPSKELAAVVGAKGISRPQVVKKLWQYIKRKKLQDKKNKRNIVCDKTLKAIFKKNKVSMFEMNKLLKKHLK